MKAADEYAETIQPIIGSLRKTGITNLRGIAIALNNRGIRTARGGEWPLLGGGNGIRNGG
jgi:hypothetical protein